MADPSVSPADTIRAALMVPGEHSAVALAITKEQAQSARAALDALLADLAEYELRARAAVLVLMGHDLEGEQWKWITVRPMSAPDNAAASPNLGRAAGEGDA